MCVHIYTYVYAHTYIYIWILTENIFCFTSTKGSERSFYLKKYIDRNLKGVWKKSVDFLYGLISEIFVVAKIFCACIERSKKDRRNSSGTIFVKTKNFDDWIDIWKIKKILWLEKVKRRDIILLIFKFWDGLSELRTMSEGIFLYFWLNQLGS